jgi:hypothetical protein
MQQVGTSYNLSPLLAFYAFEFPLFNNHRNHDELVTVIPFAMGTCQDDILGGALFAFVHLNAIYSIINHLFFCIFPSIADDIHIIGPPPLYNLHMNTSRLNSM